MKTMSALLTLKPLSLTPSVLNISLMSFALVSLALVVPQRAVSEEAVDLPALEAQAGLIAKRFGGQLKPKLITAVQSGGFVHAIDFCRVEAPKIANQLSAETGWSVKRVSLKARNTSTAKPDQFERNVLAGFDQRQQNGEPAANLKHSQVVDGQYRFMSAQAVGGLCLNCHGQTIDKSIKKALDSHYPDDKATGYSLGQIRGAFSLTKDL